MTYLGHGSNIDFSANLPLTPSGTDLSQGGHEATEVHCGAVLPRPLLASSTEASMASLYFEELQIGSRSAAGPYVLSKDEIIRFARQYDPITRHIDEQAAARSVFGGLTASGAHTFAIYILLTGQPQPHFQVLMGLGWDDVRLPNPVGPDDELDLELTVLEMRESKSRSDRGIVRKSKPVAQSEA